MFFSCSVAEDRCAHLTSGTWGVDIRVCLYIERDRSKSVLELNVLCYDESYFVPDFPSKTNFSHVNRKFEKLISITINFLDNHCIAT